MESAESARHMTAPLWRPAEEAAAGGAMAVFVEWLRATERLPAATPAAVAKWQENRPEQFLTAIAAFAGFDPACDVRANLLRHAGDRDALVVHDQSGGGRVWSRDDVRALRDLPTCVARVVSRLSWRDLLGLAADHLLLAGTRPDDRLVWTGDPAEAWPYGAWTVGAAVVLRPADPIFSSQAASFRSA